MLKRLALAALAATLLATTAFAESDFIKSNPICLDEANAGQLVYQLCFQPGDRLKPETIQQFADRLHQHFKSVSAERIIEINGWQGASPDDLIPMDIAFRGN